jgi:hypothetical protein
MKLLSELLLDRANVNSMMRYIGRAIYADRLGGVNWGFGHFLS